MKKLLSVFSVFLIITLVACGASEILGSQIKGLEQMKESGLAQVLTASENTMMVYDVENEELSKLCDLLSENTYTREKNAEISDELKENAYVVACDLGNDETLRITLYAGEYVLVDGQFDGDLLKISKPDFEKQFKEIIGIE